MRTWELKTWICVNFNQPHFEIFINHKVVSKQLKSMMMSFWINLLVNSFYCVCCQWLHLRNDVFFNTNLLFRKCLINVSLQLWIRHFIRLFVLSIIFCFLLDCIISQMNQSVCYIFEWKFFWWSSDVTLFVPISSHDSIDWHNSSITSNIKLSLLYKKWFIKILLNDVTSSNSILKCLIVLNNLLNSFKCVANVDSATSICVFSWFYNPNILSTSLWFFRIIIKLF